HIRRRVLHRHRSALLLLSTRGRDRALCQPDLAALIRNFDLPSDCWWLKSARSPIDRACWASCLGANLRYPHRFVLSRSADDWSASRSAPSPAGGVKAGKAKHCFARLNALNSVKGRSAERGWGEGGGFGRVCRGPTTMRAVHS